MKKIELLLVIIVLFGMMSCQKNVQKDNLPSWEDTDLKNALTNYLEKEVVNIPVEKRVAVFDMDGTIACESPLWMEMYCAVQGLCLQVSRDSSLLQQPIYQYAEKLKVNPKDTSVTNNYGASINAMVHSAFAGWDNESYVAFCKSYLDTAKNVDYHIPLSKTFYKPMLELLTYLKAKQFDVYIVSGSLQGLVWSVCPEVIDFDRSNLIGTRQQMQPVYTQGKMTQFILKPAILQPKNGGDGKTENIYNQIGKQPVFAFGNTTDDFGMLHFASAGSLPNMSLLLNHDDAKREYKYNPWHGSVDSVMAATWQDTLKLNKWHLVNMSSEFKVVF